MFYLVELLSRNNCELELFLSSQLSGLYLSSPHTLTTESLLFWLLFSPRTIEIRWTHFFLPR